MSLFGAHLEFKSAVFRLCPENMSPFPPLEFKSAVFRLFLEERRKTAHIRQTTPTDHVQALAPVLSVLSTLVTRVGAQL